MRPWIVLLFTSSLALASPSYDGDDLLAQESQNTKTFNLPPPSFIPQPHLNNRAPVSIVNQGNDKLIPQPGWLPITVKSPHEVQQASSESIQKPAYFPANIPTITKPLVDNPLLKAKQAKGSAPPITVFPNDTIVIHYETVAFPPPNSIVSNGKRPERATVPKAIDSRLEQLKQSCSGIDVEGFIVDLLKSPLRVRNEIVKRIQAVRNPDVIRSRPNNNNNNNRIIEATPVETNVRRPKSVVTTSNNNNNVQVSNSNNGNPTKEFISAQFSNFPAFQKVMDDRNQKPVQVTNPPVVQQQPQRPVQVIQTQPPRTQPPQTQPPRTQPPQTQPPRTQPPRTQPPRTQPPRPPVVTTTKQTFVPQQVSTSRTNNRNKSFSIEKFLERYPEVRRVSSRFGDGKPKNLDNFGQSSNNNDNNNSNDNQQQQAQVVQQQPPPQVVQQQQPQVIQRQEPQVVPQQQPQQPIRQNRQKRPQQPKRPQRKQKQQRKQKKIRPPTQVVNQQPVQVQQQQQQPPQPPAPSVAPTFGTVFESTRISDQPQPTSASAEVEIDEDFNDFEDTDNPELSSEDYSYLYYQEYYEELVPEHHRFNRVRQQATTQPPQSANRVVKKSKKKHKKQQQQQVNNNSNSNNNNNAGFSFVSNQPADVSPAQAFPNFPIANVRGVTQAPVQAQAPVRPAQPIQTQPQPQPPQPAAPAANPVALAPAAPSTQAGPYGYTDKGTFFSDQSVVGFPTQIEIIYQGFVWAMKICYDQGGCVMHGGVHKILKDKVKRQKIKLNDDYIVRVSGRASPYNINRFTLYTAKGKKYGPFGDRRSEDSNDFDVSAPEGQGLSFFSGTVDFGVPVRSISFHWRPR